MTPKERELFMKLAVRSEEVLVDLRKGVPQSIYVVEVKKDSQYWDDDSLSMLPAPESLHGYWMMKHSEDLRFRDVGDALKEYDWVRYEQREVVTSEWVAI